VQVVSKDLIRAAIGRSPDKADAAVLGLVHAMGKVRNTVTVLPWNM
jgi:hypothetical protein